MPQMKRELSVAGVSITSDEEKFDETSRKRLLVPRPSMGASNGAGGAGIFLVAKRWIWRLS